jgi:SAM-dependent methyltransferase
VTLFYRIAYGIGFAPWEHAATHPAAADQIAALFDREEAERNPPYGRALDLGCGTGFWSVELAARGWQVTGIDIVAKAIGQARARARRAGVEVRFIAGDATALRSAGVGSGFSFVWDFGAVHGLTPAQRAAVGREVTAVTTPDATMAMLAWAPGRRWPLPRGAGRADIEAAFPDWRVVDEVAFDVSGLPPPLRNVDPRCYRLRRA